MRHGDVGSGQGLTLRLVLSQNIESIGIEGEVLVERFKNVASAIVPLTIIPLRINE